MLAQIIKIIKIFIPEAGLEIFRSYKKYKLQKRLGIKLVDRSNIKFLGTEYSGYPIPTDLISENAICYCIGAGEEISFELLLSNELKSKVFLFDPTPRSITFVENLMNAEGSFSRNKDSDEEEYSVISSNNLNFLPVAIWEKDEKVKMFAPQDDTHVSHSILNLQHTENYFWAQCYTLTTIMKRFEHTKIDLLKLNVEGAEYAILYSMLDAHIKPKVLCIAFDEFHTKLDDKSDQRILQCLKRLEDENYKPVYIDNSRMTFILTDYL